MTDISAVGAAVADSFPFAPWPVEPFEVPPHPCNLQFLEALNALVMRTLGERLHRIAEGENFQWAACFVRDFFAPAFSAVPGLPITPGSIRFAPGRSQRIEPAFLVSSFADLMARIPVPELEVRCAVTRNLRWLEDALYLSTVEAKLLLWTYAISHRRSERLRNALAAVRFERESDAHAAMAVLLDEPEEAIAGCFAAPIRLLAMRLIWKGRRTVPIGLDECFEASDLLPAVLETVHRSPEAMLARLLEPEPNWTLDPKVETPSVLFYDWFEKPLADAFAATVSGRQLTADHIVALIEWLTGFRLEPAQCSPLAGHITLEAIEQALKRCFVTNGGCNRVVTPLKVLGSLYALVD